MAERLLLEIEDGSLRGQAIAVAANSLLVVGRSPECGLSISQDLSVSRQHFRIEFRPPECRLIHLSQTGETFVNEAPVSSIGLRNGDRISFGSGNLIRARFETTQDDVPATTPPAGVSHSMAPSGQVAVSTTSCGWYAYASSDSKTDFATMLAILVRSQPVYALIDFRRIGQPVPEELADGDFLLPWFPAETRSQFSPLLVSLTTNPAITEIIRAGWGRDGIVCFGSSLPVPESLTHWRTAVGMKGDEPGPSITVYYWPVLLKMMLTCQSSRQLEPLLAGLSFVFLEAAESPGNWSLYTAKPFDSTLTSVGLVPVEQKS